MTHWKQGSANNEVLHFDGFFLSYATRVNEFDLLLNTLGQIKDDNMNRPETAIVIDDKTKMFGRRHLILYGDWRNELAACADNGLEACIQFFENHLEHITDTSDTIPRTLS